MIRQLALAFFILGSQAKAKESIHTDFSTHLNLAKTKKWSCQRKLEGNRVSLEFDLGDKVATFNPPIPGSVLQKAELQRWGDTEYLVTVWQEGVHASAVRVFDPINLPGPMVWQKYSVGDVVYNTTVEGLSVTINENQSGTMETKKTTVTWKAEE